jgi:hypothetical protein
LEFALVASRQLLRPLVSLVSDLHLINDILNPLLLALTGQLLQVVVVLQVLNHRYFREKSILLGTVTYSLAKRWEVTDQTLGVERDSA